jgi:hypothetical protein
MTATTIAEIFITSDSIHVDLEVGVQDLNGFRNIMPDPIFERLGNDPEPLSQRLERFFTEDWVIRADGALLPGRVLNILPRPRVRRDEITGEPLPPSDDDDEIVVFIELGYELPGRSRSLSLHPPGSGGFVGANIGFVTYHEGLPVTDFRYLSAEETIDLDWDDPWYSRFRNRNLRRQFDAPMSAFLYVEHFEVRKEIVVRPRDLQQWIDLGLEGKDVIAVEDQADIKAKVAGFFMERGAVTIDGREGEPTLDRIHFVRRTLRRTGVIEPPEPIPAVSATLGVIFVYPIDSLPDAVSMTWDVFGGRIQKVPVSATDEAGGLPSILSPEDPVLEWQNFLTNPTIPALVDIKPAPTFGRMPVPLLSALCGLLFVGTLAGYARANARRGRLMLTGAVLVVLGAVSWPLARVPVPVPFVKNAVVSVGEAETIVSGLLTNVYRAFDYRDESDIYDALARNASGELLTQIYLETRRSLELQNQGGARVKVDEVTMTAVEPSRLPGEIGFAARCTWNVRGSVGHWGHIHKRTNQYDAELTIESIDGAWKITGIELLEEQRISRGARQSTDDPSVMAVLSL